MAADRTSGEDERLRQLVVRQARLIEISVTLNSTLDRNALLQFIIHSAADLVESQAALLLLLDPMNQRLSFAAVTGRDPGDLAATPVPLEGSIAGSIFRDNRALILNRIGGEDRSAPSSLGFRTRCLAGVPMRIRGEVVGVLEAVNKRGGEFTEDDLQMLSIIASQAAVAIHNAQLVEDLRQANEDLGRLDRLKSDFMAVASHELRTPLGLILGYAAILQEESREGAAEHAAAVFESAMRMRSLIEDMTSMNLLSGIEPPVLAPCTLQDVLRTACAGVAAQMEERHHTFTQRLPKASIIGRLNAGQLELAVRNLLTNACRFTPEGSQIDLSLERQPQEVWIRVHDNGPGIPRPSLERIFDAFYQLEDHMTRRHEGLGLGLAIVRAVAAAHGGRVWAESPGPGGGSTFVLAIPIQETDAPAS
jgi:signal transduction histidine kinase